MNKAFSLFLMVALILGGALGGAFASGVALGKTQGEIPSEARTAGNFTQGGGSQADDFGGNRSQGRGQGIGPGGPRQRGGQSGGPGGDGQQRFGRGGPDSQSGSRPEGADRQGLEGGFQGRRGEDADGGGRRGGRGVGGAIESVEGNTLTVTTPRGPVTVTTDAETTVRKMVEGSLEDLKQGAQIRVIGPRDEDGNVTATAITLIPEGAQESFGRRGQRQER